MGRMDELISPSVVRQLRALVQQFDASRALDSLVLAERSVVDVRLRERVNTVRDALLADLPPDFATTEQMVRALLEQPEFVGWMIWPASEWVTTRALAGNSPADFDAAMALLAGVTVRLSAEFAVRDLLVARPERGLQIMRTWTDEPNEHVRRLASERSRAYLPWGRRVPWLIDHPNATVAILDGLHRDDSEYVRRSVANHLNDLSRVAPDVVTSTAARWAGRPDVNTAWVVRHGLRTLVKRGDARALELTGFTGGDLRVERPEVSPGTVPWGGTVTFSTTVTNHGVSEANVAIDYAIGFRRADGSVRPTTFKLASRRLGPGESVAVQKSHSFRPITTRAYYPGRHTVAVQANGLLSAPTEFRLATDSSSAARGRRRGVAEGKPR